MSGGDTWWADPELARCTTAADSEMCQSSTAVNLLTFVMHWSCDWLMRIFEFPVK